MKVLVASTMCTFAVKHPDPRLSQSWLMSALTVPDGVELEYFAALELDPNGMTEPFWSTLQQMDSKPRRRGYWTFTVDDGRDQVTTQNRLHHIVTGRNLIQDYAMGTGIDWILFLDADMQPQEDTIPRLLELNWPLVGGNVPTYALRGRQVGPPRYPTEWNVQDHMNTAGYLMVHREVFRRIRWRIDPDRGMTDDPCYHADALACGWPTFVRHDVTGTHYPESLPPLERRGYDLSVQL